MDNKPKENILLTISDIAEQLDISTRAIRFYEEKGLILPGRTKGNHRVYTRRDRTRLKLIMRGKRLGYSLDEIAEMIGLAEFNKDEIEQLNTSLAFGERKLKEINERMEELMILKQDLLAIQQKIINRLEEISTEKPSQLIKEAHHGDC